MASSTPSLARPSSGPLSYTLPTAEGLWTPGSSRVGRLPEGTGTVEIRGIGTFAFEAAEVRTLRPDILQAGHFSMFDVLAHLGQRGDIALDYHLDETMATHVVDAINDQRHWWYQTYYAGGWPEPNAFRMDMYPYKNKTHLMFYREREDRLTAIHETFRDETARLARNGGQVIVPELTIRSPRGVWRFKDVVTTAHHARPDLLQPGVVTALDMLLSLGEQGEIGNIKLTWYDRIGFAEPIDSFWVELIQDAEASGGCGFVYETGPQRLAGFSGSHIHLPADARAIVSPEYALWFWICL